MCKFNQNFRSLFWKILFLCTIAHHVFADDILWESGINLYIKLDKQDKSVSGKTTPNNHPVELSEKHIAESLELLELWSKDYYEDGNAENVFTVTQSRLLGEHIANFKSIRDLNNFSWSSLNTGHYFLNLENSISSKTYKIVKL